VLSDTSNIRTSAARMKGLRCFHALIGVIFVVLALLHTPHPQPLLWLPYAAGAALAAMTLVPRLMAVASRLLAVAATALMFFLFAGFFMEVPKLAAGWYQSQEGWAAVSRLLAAFLLLPLLSEFSCRCKADCREMRHSGRRRNSGFFSAPDRAG
jgi:hypothetical protein